VATVAAAPLPLLGADAPTVRVGLPPSNTQALRGPAGRLGSHRENYRRRCRIRLYQIKTPRRASAARARCGRAFGPSSRAPASSTEHGG
jgi:hypothetical protein